MAKHRIRARVKQQAAATIAKATQLLAVICRSFALLDERTLPILYKSLMRPHLKFRNLGGHFNRADQKKLERVQRRATRLMTRLHYQPYETRLKSPQLPSLYYRRKRGDMIFRYQLFHNRVDADPTDFFSLASGRSTRGHPFLQAPCNQQGEKISIRSPSHQQLE